MRKLLWLLLISSVVFIPLAYGQTHVAPALDLPNTFTGPNTFTNVLTLSGLTDGCLTVASGIVTSSAGPCGGGGTPGGSNQQIQFNNNGVFGAAAGLTSDTSGNVLMPGTLGVTGQVNGTTAGFTGNVSALSFTTTGGGAMHVHTAFGATPATPLAGQNGITFANDGSLQCYQNGGAVGNCFVPGVVINPAISQSIVQPSVGRPSEGTSFDANVFAQVRYNDALQKQFPLFPAGTISVGVNTITINAVRGISTYSCVSPGTGCANTFGTRGTTQYLRIAGTGTPEQVKIDGTNCVGANTGTCTITFTAANTHSAGYTVSSATGGIMEALVDSYSLSSNNPVGSRTIACSPYPENGHYIIYAQIVVDDLPATNSPQTFLEGNGCVLEDAVSGAPMIKLNSNAVHATIENFTFATLVGIGRAANGTQVFVYDQSQLMHFTRNHFALPANGNAGTDVVDTVVEVNADQNATIDLNDFEGVPMKCDSTWCGPIIYGDAVSNAAIGIINANYFSTNQDPFKWDSGNGVSFANNVFQNWIHYPYKYKGGLLAPANQGGNYYEGNCSLINPDFIDVAHSSTGAGYSCNTGPQVETSGSQTEYSPFQDRNGAGLAHRFTATGANVYTYYIVGHSGTSRTRPLFIGDAATDGTTNFNVFYLKFGADTYDILRSGPAVGDGTDTSPFGTANWAVATGLVCSANPCFYQETFAAPTSYNVSTDSVTVTYTPPIDYWPVPLFIHGSSTSPSTYRGPVTTFVNGSAVTGAVGYYDGTFTSESGGEEQLTGMHVLHMGPLQNGGTSHNPGAMILNPDIQTNSFTGFKGRINMPSYSVPNNVYLSNHDNILYQTFDPDSAKTMATPGHQPKLNAAGTDCGMGYDNNASYLMFMCGNPISFYVAHKPDSGTSPVFQLLTTGGKTRLQFTSTLATGTAPFAITSTTPVPNLSATPTTYNAAGTQQTNAHIVEGTCTLGTSCAITLTGAAVFTGAASYACTAEDTTAIAATRVVQASGSSVTFTGTGTDVLVYHCVGN